MYGQEVQRRTRFSSWKTWRMNSNAIIPPRFPAFFLARIKRTRAKTFFKTRNRKKIDPIARKKQQTLIFQRFYWEALTYHVHLYHTAHFKARPILDLFKSVLSINIKNHAFSPIFTRDPRRLNTILRIFMKVNIFVIFKREKRAVGHDKWPCGHFQKIKAGGRAW